LFPPSPPFLLVIYRLVSFLIFEVWGSRGACLTLPCCTPNICVASGYLFPGGSRVFPFSLPKPPHFPRRWEPLSAPSRGRLGFSFPLFPPPHSVVLKFLYQGFRLFLDGDSPALLVFLSHDHGPPIPLLGWCFANGGAREFPFFYAPLVCPPLQIVLLFWSVFWGPRSSDPTWPQGPSPSFSSMMFSL